MQAFIFGIPLFFIVVLTLTYSYIASLKRRVEKEWGNLRKLKEMEAANKPLTSEIESARNRYNEAVERYNRRLLRFPTNVVAMTGKFFLAEKDEPVNSQTH